MSSNEFNFFSIRHGSLKAFTYNFKRYEQKIFSIFNNYFLFKKVKRVIEFTGHKYSFKQNLLFLEETLNRNGF